MSSPLISTEVVERVPVRCVVEPRHSTPKILWIKLSTGFPQANYRSLLATAIREDPSVISYSSEMWFRRLGPSTHVQPVRVQFDVATTVRRTLAPAAAQTSARCTVTSVQLLKQHDHRSLSCPTMLLPTFRRLNLAKRT